MSRATPSRAAPRSLTRHRPDPRKAGRDRRSYAARHGASARADWNTPPPRLPSVRAARPEAAGPRSSRAGGPPRERSSRSGRPKRAVEAAQTAVAQRPLDRACPEEGANRPAVRTHGETVHEDHDPPGIEARPPGRRPIDEGRARLHPEPVALAARRNVRAVIQSRRPAPLRHLTHAPSRLREPARAPAAGPLTATPGVPSRLRCGRFRRRYAQASAVPGHRRSARP